MERPRAGIDELHVKCGYDQGHVAPPCTIAYGGTSLLMRAPNVERKGVYAGCD
jgi:hypothetical protein